MAQKTQAEKNVVDKAMQAFAQTKLGGRLFITVFPAIDRKLMPLTRGRIQVGMGQPMGLLHAIGAKSGEPRPTPLLYIEDGERILLIASKAGAVKHPAWYHNLKAHPDVEIEIRGRRVPVHAREAQGDERERLWRLANDVYSGYDTYQVRAGSRRIPVMVLEPRA